jgi:hypothetical protein
MLPDIAGCSAVPVVDAPSAAGAATDELVGAARAPMAPSPMMEPVTAHATATVAPTRRKADPVLRLLEGMLSCE